MLAEAERVRWEGNPSSNIRILNNTVSHCPYAPNISSPAISVYAGENDAGAKHPINHNVEVRGNLVLGCLVRSAGCCPDHGSSLYC